MKVRTLGRFMVVTALVALVASVGGGVAGVILVDELDDTLGRSLDLTVDALAAVDDSLAVAADTLALVDDGLSDTQQASEDVVTALRTGADLLEATADLTEDELAPGITAVEESLPNVVTVASAVDAALSGLSRLPLGIAYDPAEGLDDSLRQLETSLAGTGAELAGQSQLIREAAAELTDVAAGTEAIATDLVQLDGGIADARVLVDDYAVTADETRTLLTATRADLDVRAAVAVGMVGLLALAVALAQLPTLYIGRQLLRNADRIQGMADAVAAPHPDGTAGA